MNKKSFNLLCIMFVSSPVSAGTSFDDLMDYSLQELANLSVETATRHREPLDRSSATIYVITEQDIRTFGYRTLADVLENVPGLETINLGFFLQGGQRGLVGNFANTLLLVNGREISALGTQEALIGDQFGVDNIQQIEVMNSPGSALYGANAYSGVINILTKDAKFRSNLSSAHIEVGSENTRTMSILSERSDDDRSFSFYFREHRSDNWDFGQFVADSKRFSEGFPNVAQNAAAQAGQNYRNDNNARNWAVHLEASGFYLGTNGYEMESGKGLETVALDYDSQSDNRVQNLWYTGWTGQLGANLVTAEYQLLRSRLWGVNYEFRNDTWEDKLASGRDPSAPISAEEIYSDFRYVYSQENSSGSERHRGFLQLQRQLNPNSTLILGLVNEYSDLLGVLTGRDDLSPSFNEMVSESNPLHRPIFRSHKKSAYAQWQDCFLTCKLDVTLGARIDNQTHYGTEPTFRGGLVFHQSASTHWRFHYGEAFREPTIFELDIISPDGTQQFEKLVPAKIRSFEIGVTHRLDDSQQIRLTAFDNQAQNAIASVSTTGFSNLSIDTHGLEGTYDLRSGRWRGDVSYTFTKSSSQSVNNEFIESLNAYPHRVSLGGAYTPTEAWQIGVRANYFSSMTAEHGNPLIRRSIDIDSATRIDANIRYFTTFFESNDMEFALHIKNILDTRYYQPNVRNSGPREFLQPGRQWVLSVLLQY